MNNLAERIERSLFRGKRKDNCKWELGAYLLHFKRQLCPFGDSYTDKDIVHLIIKSGFADWNLPRPIEGVPVDRATVGQCTGEQDMNQMLIFEGDVLSDGQHEGIVEWRDGGWCLCYRKKNGFTDNNNLVDVCSSNFIAGNIHDGCPGDFVLGVEANGAEFASI